MPNLHPLAEGLKAIVLDTGAMVRESRPDPALTKRKGLNDFATETDLKAEQKLVAELTKLLPGSTFLTEEKTTKQSQGEYRWIIDPIDGTTNFMYGLPCYAISVALEYKGAIVLGCVYEISRDEYFAATADGPATLNGQLIQVGQCDALADALIATGFPYQNEAWLGRWLEVFADVQQSSRGVRRWGAAAVDLAYVACGRFDGYYEFGLNPWDCAAGALLVERAGGEVYNFEGVAADVTKAGADERAIFQQQIIVGNPKVAAALVSKIPTIQ